MTSNAAQLLAQSEFNRYYIRVLCLKAVSEGLTEVEVYCTRASSWQRPNSKARIGSRLNASDLLHDLRTSIGGEPKIMPEINSGLSARI